VCEGPFWITVFRNTPARNARWCYQAPGSVDVRPPNIDGVLEVLSLFAQGAGRECRGRGRRLGWFLIEDSYH